MRVPSRVVGLGRCVEVRFSDGRVWRTGRSPRAELCCSPSGKTLWVLRVGQKEKNNRVSSRVLKRFTGFEADGTRTASVRDSKRIIRLGKVKSIVYESDKWDRKLRKYIHTFRNYPSASTDKANDPTFVKISGGRIRVRSTGIHG